MTMGTQIDFSDLLNPSQLFIKLANSTLELINQYISEKVQGKAYFDRKLNEAVLYIQTGQYEKGRDLLISGVLKYDKYNTAALFAMGFALIRLNEVERGLEHFEKVFKKGHAVDLEEQTYFYSALIAYAAGLLEHQRFSRTVLICERINRLRPDEFEAWAIRAEALKSLKRYKESIAFYQKTLELNPEHKNAQEGLKECKLLLPDIGKSFKPTKTRSPQRPPQVLKGTKERVFSPQNPKTRLPQKPPEVDPKHKREYIGKLVFETRLDT